MTEVESKFDILQDNFNELEKRLVEVEKRIDTNKNRNGGQVLDTSSMIREGCPRQERYWRARRSLRMWPIEGDGEEMRIGLQRFHSQRLGLGEDVLSDMVECSLRRIQPSKKNGPSGLAHEITVEFPTVDLKYVVRGAAYNLAGRSDAGIRLEIVHHLMSNFKALSSASHKLKQRYPTCKHNIKYDNEEMDLVGTRLLNRRCCCQVEEIEASPAKELMLNDGDAAQEVTTADLTGLLSWTADGGGEEGVGRRGRRRRILTRSGRRLDFIIRRSVKCQNQRKEKRRPIR